MASTAEMKPASAIIPPPWKPAERNDLRREEEVTTVWVLWVKAGVPFDALTDSDYHAAYGYKLHPGDKIRAIYDDMSAEADLRVLSAGQGWARVHCAGVIHYPTTIADEAADFDDAYMIEHGGASSLYIVVRKIDGQVLSKGHPNRQAAVAWLMAHLAAKQAQAK